MIKIKPQSALYAANK